MVAQKILDYSIAAVSGAMASQVKDVLTVQYLWLVVLTPPLVAVATFFVLHGLKTLLVEKNHRFRKWLIPLARLEGRWINYSEWQGEKRCGIFDLFYDQQTGQHFISGDSFLKESGKHVAHWHSQPIIFNLRELSLEYRFWGESKRTAAAKEEPKILKIEGWTTIHLNHPDATTGYGYFINFHPDPARTLFKVKELTEEVVNRLRTESNFPDDTDILNHLSAKAT